MDSHTDRQVYEVQGEGTLTEQEEICVCTEKVKKRRSTTVKEEELGEDPRELRLHYGCR